MSLFQKNTGTQKPFFQEVLKHYMLPKELKLQIRNAPYGSMVSLSFMFSCLECHTVTVHVTSV